MRQALLTINLAKWDVYRFEPYLVGVADISGANVIDIDKERIF